MKNNIFILGNDDYSQTIENASSEVLEYMKNNHPESRFVGLENCPNAFEDYIIGIIIREGFINNKDLKQGDIIYLDYIQSEDELCLYILETLNNYSDYHLVVLNSEYTKKSRRYMLYPRHNDKQHTGVDLLSNI